MISIEDCAEFTITGLKVHVHGNEERLIQAPRGLEVASVLKRSKKERRLGGESSTCTVFEAHTEEVRCDQCWAWLQNGDMKRETESDSSESECKNKLVKARIGKSQGDSLYRVCREVDESIDHIVSDCSKLPQKECKRRDDNLGEIVLWKLARKYNFEGGDKWY